MKIQKLIYYSQAWSLVWDGTSLFDEAIEAWADGPVVRSVFGRRKFGIEGGDADALSPDQQATIREVLRVYARHDGDWLSALTHREPPWCEARGSAPKGSPSRNEIERPTMAAFYGSAAVQRKHISDAYHRGLRVLVSLPEDEASRLFKQEKSIDGAAGITWLEDAGRSPWHASSG